MQRRIYRVSREHLLQRKLLLILHIVQLTREKLHAFEVRGAKQKGNVLEALDPSTDIYSPIDVYIYKALELWSGVKRTVEICNSAFICSVKF